MNQNESMIDRVLVHLFNDLLRIEERTLQKQVGDLSMREVHIIEAVCAAQTQDNTMTVLAATLRVTVGSLTVAVQTLERKGYLIRRRSSSDKRRVHVLPLPPCPGGGKASPGNPPAHGGRCDHNRLTRAAGRADPEPACHL